MPDFKDVYDEKYLLLTTFTKDGRPKPTPVWGVPHGDKLLISTDDGSWKTKRINNIRESPSRSAGCSASPRANPSRQSLAICRNPKPGAYSTW